MKSLIIFSSMSGNTEELGNKMKEVLEKYNHEVDIVRDKKFKTKLKENEDFLEQYELLCVGSCTHANNASSGTKRVTKTIAEKKLENKKLLCFGTSGGPMAWQNACKDIQEALPDFEHVGDIGCSERKNEDTIKDFEDLVKNL